MGRDVGDVKATPAVATGAGEEKQKDGGLQTDTSVPAETDTSVPEVIVARADGDCVALGTADNKKEGEAEAKGARELGDGVAPGAADKK